MRSFLSSDANFRYCLAEGCNSGQVHDGDAAQANIFRCAACHFRVCTVHDVAFHDDETCDQYDSRRQREEQEAHEAWEDDNRRADELTQSQKYMTENSVSCPGCTVQIQKITGCDHMTCKSIPTLMHCDLNIDTGMKVPGAGSSSATSAVRYTAAPVALGLQATRHT